MIDPILTTTTATSSISNVSLPVSSHSFSGAGSIHSSTLSPDISAPYLKTKLNQCGERNNESLQEEIDKFKKQINFCDIALKHLRKIRKKQLEHIDLDVNFTGYPQRLRNYLKEHEKEKECVAIDENFLVELSKLVLVVDYSKRNDEEFFGYCKLSKCFKIMRIEREVKQRELECLLENTGLELSPPARAKTREDLIGECGVKIGKLQEIQEGWVLENARFQKSFEKFVKIKDKMLDENEKKISWLGFCIQFPPVMKVTDLFDELIIKYRENIKKMIHNFYSEYLDVTTHPDLNDFLCKIYVLNKYVSSEYITCIIDDEQFSKCVSDFELLIKELSKIFSDIRNKLEQLQTLQPIPVVMPSMSSPSSVLTSVSLFSLPNPSLQQQTPALSSSSSSAIAKVSTTMSSSPASSRNGGILLQSMQCLLMLPPAPRKPLSAPHTQTSQLFSSAAPSSNDIPSVFKDF